jgi:hypothetical protein
MLPRSRSIIAAALTVVLVAALSGASAPAADAAKAGTIAGNLRGAKLPSTASGRVPIWAMRLSDGRVLGAAYAGHGGKFSLKLPRGNYALLAAIVKLGRKPPLVRVADLVSVKAGKRTRIRPSMKKNKKARRSQSAASAAKHTPRSAWVNVDTPAIWVKRFQVQASNPDFRILEKGLADMTITDLVAELGAAGCAADVVERERLNEVIAELNLQQSPYFDSSTRVQKGKLIRENATVQGTFTQTDTGVSISAKYTDLKTGRSGTVSVSGPGEDLFDLTPQLARKLVNQVICPKIPKQYSAQISGQYDMTVGASEAHVTWSGNAAFALAEENFPLAPEGWPQNNYAHYTLTGGTVQATLDGARNSDGGPTSSCLRHASAGIALQPGALSGELWIERKEPQRAVKVTVSPPFDAAIAFTEPGTPIGCNASGDFSIGAGQLLFAFTDTPLIASDWSFSGSGGASMPPLSKYTTQFGFQPVY